MGLGVGILGSSGISAIGGALGASAQRDAAREAEAGLAAQREQILGQVSPFIEPGQQAVGAQAELLGLGGVDAQQAAIDALRDAPLFQAGQQEAERTLLANAAATGGLRGGNTQRALATLSPALLNQAVQTQLSNLGGLVGSGLTATGQFAGSAVPLAQNIASAQQAQGAAQAQGIGAITGGIGGAVGQFGNLGLTNQLLSNQGFSPVKVF